MLMRELRTLVTVADAGSFLQASRILFLTPASLMNQINKLEAQVEAKLLKRTTQGVSLTAAGEAFCKDARKIISLADEAAGRARQIAAGEKNVIRIGSSLLRPANRLIDSCENANDGERSPFQFHIIPFEDNPDSLSLALDSLGHQLDCIVGPCDSTEWKAKYSVLLLGDVPCRIAMPRSHHLAKKQSLAWDDLDGEEIMVIERGDSPVLDRMRDDILSNHPRVRIRDAPHKYDSEVFNECLQTNCLMETLDVWRDAHPSLVTLPMKWEYAIPYGIIHAKQPSPAVREFTHFVKQHIARLA